MKTKKCPQCKNIISITAPTCLYCGRPNKFVTNNYVKMKWDKDYKENNKNIFRVLMSKKILYIFIIILIIFFISIYQ